MSTILVVEDDPRIQKALERQFTMEGYTVHVSGDGAEGLAACKALHPAGVVLDLMLPGMPGREVCKNIKSWSPNTPVVVLSAVSEVADKVLLLELGAAGVELAGPLFQKPYCAAPCKDLTPGA